MNGLIFNLQRFCVNDGPGIRTTVFFKGCNLRCAWCHNPESQSSEPEFLYDESLCGFCGACVSACKNNARVIKDRQMVFHLQKCSRCGNCVAACQRNALETAGISISAEDVLAEVLKDKVFYDNSGGGLTLSGGEPLLQFDFALELFKKAKAHDIHTCIETCGYVATEKIQKIAEYTDLFLYDWKLTDTRLHKEYTGVGNELIEKNLRTVDKMGIGIILRCPIIPNVNDTNDHFGGIAALANSLSHVIEIEIEPYHSLGEHKYKKLGRKNVLSFRMPDSNESDGWIQTIQQHTTIPVKRA